MKSLHTLFFCLAMILSSCTGAPTQPPLMAVIDSELKIAEQQALLMARQLEGQDSLLPRSFIDGALTTTKSRWWCSGFFPGSLWYLYENFSNPKVLNYAKLFTARVEKEKYTTDNHDVGFMLYCSFGNGYRITGDTAYANVLLTGARSLSTRFNPNIRLIQSWRARPKWQYPVIIDNMMNLELLMWAAKTSNDAMFSDISISHANRTMEEHFRPDYSCYHVVSYDTLSFLPHAKNTAQGYQDETSWARGQAWALYGYTMMYRETGDKAYLEHACGIADYITKLPSMPEDHIPYWDYFAPNIPNEPRDASAAAIVCSALIELSDYVAPDLAKAYLAVAEMQIRTLATPQYTAKVGENGNFLLMHSVGSLPSKSEVDVPLTYADYYYIEALTRMKKKILNAAN